MDTFKTLQAEISQALVATTRSASRISSADITFQRSLNPEVGTQLDAQNARLLHLAQRLLENAASSSDAVGPKLPDVESVDANWKGVVDVIDSLLEKADISLDEYTGVVKRLSPIGEQAAVKPRPNIAEKKIIPKPQLNFEHVPKNDETGGFRPLLASKPHAKVSLENCMKKFKDRRGREQYPHPYQTEIESYDFPPNVYEHFEPQQYQPFESTTATFVDTPEALAIMLAELKTAKEIAIDIEHHDNRSYIGIVSLMQISTRDKDWIVDTLKPWRRKLECLNEVFADPNILKVLHGAYMDIIWLQRDLGLYVVGLFDTYHAARSLGYPGASLAYLLDRFVNFKAQKQYQIADWRVRPLGNELFEYARADTHFLLYIYDNMRNELVEKSNFSDPERNKVQDVLLKSKEVALQRYEHPVYDTKLGLGPVGWYKLISRTPAQFTPQQFSVFRAVHKWRDNLSRKEDENPTFIMPNHAVFSVARAIPTDKPALYIAIQHVSHIVRAKADELVNVITEAKKEGLDGPELTDVLKTIADMKEAEWTAKSDTPNKVAPAPAAPAVQAESAPLMSTVAIPATRAPSSTFWGKLWSHSSAYQQGSMPTVNIDLALPLPPLTAEIFADGNRVTPESEKPQHTFVPKEDRTEDQRTDMFVVKQLGGRKRKRGDAPEVQSLSTPALDPMTNDEIMLDAQEDSPEAILLQEKAARKAARKQKKKEQTAQAAAKDDDEPAFDYANAPTVLHAEDGDGKKKKKDKKKKPAGFAPFSGLTNAPKGLPRAQKEVPGRSRTFKS
ncbi:exosome complex exonuclease-like protein Rrp6 [Cucurbitaria berberidis CBS 394.84]|uniref:Exosome complex exonuclease-like protein Rrp6 n=1 Tax=Cucurbitaria berberidis CBS 394.84 TaxID=1168544 RepID=A0A9P4GEF4_9PLEO|nr:exosome complex exonuclease-like protein Rrp6 [Cucurbitaria berberidis CBS 394.84]KAF1843976.1 exosome complex exonuclease-like protein Rrp6 [Cucurbitaria berberidis CBS 394.84]